MIDGLLVARYAALPSRGSIADQGGEIDGLVARLRELILHLLGPTALAVVDAAGADPDALRTIAGAIEEAAQKDPELAREITHLCDELARRRSQEPPPPHRSRSCPQCGKKNRPDEHFCSNCGAYLDWLLPSLPTEAVEPAAPSVGPPPVRPDVDVEAAVTALRPPAPVQHQPLPRPRRATRRSRRERGRPAPSPPSQHAQATIDNALSTYVERGRLLFNPPEHMRQGRPERVTVAIAQHGGLDAQLRALAPASEDAPIHDIETTPFMEVELTGSAFSIASLQLGDAAEQLLRLTALWQFDVTAERSGTHPLQLRVAMRIPLPDRPDERVSLPVLERTVRVRVDPAYSGRRFVHAHWQWLAATVAGLGGAIAAWMKVFQG